MNKKQHAEFEKKATAILIRHGAQPGEYMLYTRQIMTKAGKLWVHIWDHEKGDKVFTITCRFDDPAKAKQVLGKDERLNPYSGKWNFHEFEADVLLYLLEKELSAISLKESEEIPY